MGTYEQCKNIDLENGEHPASKAITLSSANVFWTSSPVVGYPDVAWSAYFLRGGVGYDLRNNLGHALRLVRAGQLLGGEAALEFANEKADRIAAVERRRVGEEARRKELAQQRAEETERQRIADERQRIAGDRQRAEEERQRQVEQAKERKRLADFRKSLREGDDTNCGPVIEAKGKLVKVSFAIANYGNEHWVKREQILSPDYGCRFVNGQYQSE